LNLTFEVREGIIKHSRDYSATKFPELAEYLLDLRPPLEAQLIDITDELAYSTADLDDGFEARLLKLEAISEGVPVFKQLLREVQKLYPKAAKKLQFNEVLRRILDRWVGDLIQNTRAEVERLAGTTALDQLAPAAAEFSGRSDSASIATAAERRQSTVHGVSRRNTARLAPAPEEPKEHEASEDACSTLTLDDIRSSPRRLAGLSPEAEAERRQTKEFLYENLYLNPELQPEKENAERIISGLFDLWMKYPEKMPNAYQEKAASDARARVICDYIAGMTDTYIAEQYERHCG
jgi:dGTP triphosphohydrolase